MNKKNKFIFSIALFFGFFERILALIAFFLPIQFISSINRGQISGRLRFFFNLLNFKIINSENQIIFFSLILLFLLLAIFIISRLKGKFINIYKDNIIKDLIRKEYYEHNPNLDNVDKYIDNYSLIIFCAALLIFLTFYDYIIGIIVICSGIVTFIVINKIDYLYTLKITAIRNKKYQNIKNLNKLNILSQIKTRHKGNFFIAESIINVSTMASIMYSIFFRNDPEISIINIFIVRLYLNRMRSVIKNINFNYIKNKILYFKRIINNYFL